MSKKRSQTPESTKEEIIRKSNNKCCVCQTPFIQIHHIDGNSDNNDMDNLAPLCLNCHHQAESEGGLAIELTPSRIKSLRDKWYDYCETREESLGIKPRLSILKVKNFKNSVGFPRIGWSKQFSGLDPKYEDMTVDEIINRIFATTNREEIITYLTSMKTMYSNVLQDEENLEKFKDLCEDFSVDYDRLE